MLYYTPFMFGLVSLHAHVKQVYSSQVIFTLLYSLSILHHAKNKHIYWSKPVVDGFDKLVAHATILHAIIIGRQVALACNNPIPFLSSLTPCLVAIWTFYVTKLNYHPVTGDYWHALVCHIIPSIGYHITLSYVKVPWPMSEKMIL